MQSYMQIMQGLIQKMLTILLRFLLLYFGVCLIWMVVMWSTKSPVRILGPGIGLINFILTFSHSLFYVLIKSAVLLYKKVITKWGIKQFCDFILNWLWILVRLGFSVGGVILIGRLVIDSFSNAARNHPMIFWGLCIVVFISVGIHAAPHIGGTFHMTRVRASSAPWVEFRLFYELLDAFLRFILGTYLISLFCLFPHELHEKHG